jgi:general secretion pathway protein M
VAIKLAKREKYFVSIATCMIAVFFMFQLLIFPFLEERERLIKGIKTKEDGLREIAALSAEYQDYKRYSESLNTVLAKRKKGFTLFSFLENAAGEAQVKEHINYMKPSSSKGTGPYQELMVEMKLEVITIDQLVNYLYLIEDPVELIFIKRISISDSKKEEGYLDSVLQVMTFE